MTTHTVILLNPPEIRDDDGLTTTLAICSEHPRQAALAAQRMSAGNYDFKLDPEAFEVIAVYYGIPDLELSSDDF